MSRKEALTQRIKFIAISFSVLMVIDWDRAIYEVMCLLGCDHDRAVNLLGESIKQLHD